MNELEQFFCPNEHCKDYGMRCQANDAFALSLGKTKVAICFFVAPAASALPLPMIAHYLAFICRPRRSDRSSTKTLAEGVGVRATARLLELDKDTINRVILRAGEHCAYVLSDLLTSLKLNEVQLDELWAFIKKKILAAPKTSNASTGARGPGRLSMPPRAC